jgi:hypothetical protein
LPRVRQIFVALLAVAALIAVASPANADPSGRDLRRAKQRAAALQHQAERQARQVRSMQSRVMTATVAANEALDRWVQARGRSADAAKAAADADARVAAARRRTGDARSRLNDYAASAYKAGSAASQLGSVLALADGDPNAFVSGMTMLGQVGSAESQVIDDLRVAEHDERTASAHARDTAAAAAAAVGAAKAAKAHADSIVAAQKSQLRSLQRLLSLTRHAASSAKSRAKAMEHALRVAEARARAARRAAHARVAGARCAGGDLSGYPNGRLPMAALCTLWGAPNMVLTKPAAMAFNRMSRAYAAQFGLPMCVRDAYRTYDEQVSIKASRGSYAARPGTSEHGWGRAVDLCGGIQTDGTATNTWMRLNAPQFGWFHPRWADAGGGGPYEPWHWEFAG